MTTRLPWGVLDFVSSDYLVGGHFTRIQVQSQTPEHGLTLNSDSYLLAGQMFPAPRSLQSQKLTWASGRLNMKLSTPPIQPAVETRQSRDACAGAGAGFLLAI